MFKGESTGPRRICPGGAPRQFGCKMGR